MTVRGRVAHLTSVHPPYDRRICQQLDTLRQAGWEVCLVAQDGRFQVPDVSHLTIPKPHSRAARVFISAWQVFTQARTSGARICHFHDPELLPIGVLLALMGRKVVYDVHEDMPLLVLNKPWLAPWLRRPLSWLTGAAEWIATRLFFSAVIAATPPIAKRFPAATTATVQNFPELGQTPRADGPPLAAREDRAVYIGVLDKNRGVREIIQALGLSANPETRLILGGAFSGDGFEEACRALPAWARVDFCGWLDRTQVKAALAEAKVGLVTLAPLPNYLEAYPTKLFEYMAAGIPMVASDFPLWRSIVEGADCGLLVDPERPEEIARAMDWLMAHPEEAERMGQNGMRAVAETYNWENEGAKLTALYARL